MTSEAFVREAFARHCAEVDVAVIGGVMGLFDGAATDRYTGSSAHVARLLREAGAELAPFSPLHDAGLPSGLGGIHLGGGFPEEFAARLAGNASMRAAVRDFAGVIFAECGGLIYLCETFVALDGVAHTMAGRISCRIGMTRRLQACGYRELTLQRGCPRGPAGTAVRGHEFHWSQWVKRPDHGWGALRAGADVFGYSDERTLASFFHFHLGSRPALARWIVQRTGSGGGSCRIRAATWGFARASEDNEP